MKVNKKVEKKEKKEVVTALICPDCGGTEVEFMAGLISGFKYHCQQCHYRGAFILERQVVIHDDEEIEEI
jgi:ribosomal protein S27AE